MMALELSPDAGRRFFSVAVVFGGLALAGLTVAGRPVYGVGAYVLAMGISAGAVGLTDSTVFDERDEAVSTEAARRTLMLLGLTSAVVFPALTLAWGLGLFDWQPWSSAIAMFVAALFLVYGGFVVLLGQRR